MKSIVSPLILFGVVLISGCAKESDNVAPLISELSLNGESRNSIGYSGSNLRLVALLEDNEALGQYKIDIHDAFDGHSHSKLNARPWMFLKIQDLKGKQERIELDIPIPVDAAAGPYHFLLSLIDQAGNEAPFYEINLTLIHPADTVAPVLNISNPAVGAAFNRGDRFNIDFSATDDVALRNAEVLIRRQNSPNRLLFENVPLQGTQASHSMQVETNGINWVKGNYELVIRLTDHVYNADRIIHSFTLN